MFIIESHKLCWQRECPPCCVYRAVQSITDVMMNNEKSNHADQALFYHLACFVLANKKLLDWVSKNKIWKVLTHPLGSEEMKKVNYASCALLVAEIYASNAIEMSCIVKLHAKTVALENSSVISQTADGKKTIVSPIDILRILRMHDILAKKGNFIHALSYDSYQFIQSLRSMRNDLKSHGLTPKIPGYDLLLNCFELSIISKIPLFIRRLDVTISRFTKIEKTTSFASLPTAKDSFEYSDPIFSHLEKFFLELMLINTCNVVRKPGDFLFNSATYYRVNSPILFFDKSFYCLFDKSMKKPEFYRCSLNMAAAKGLDALQRTELQSCFFNLSYSLVERESDDLSQLHEARKKRKLE